MGAEQPPAARKTAKEHMHMCFYTCGITPHLLIPRMLSLSQHIVRI